MQQVGIIGASGYSGAELVKLVDAHPHLEVRSLFVSKTSADANKSFSDLYPRFSHLGDHKLIPLGEDKLDEVADQHDIILLATPHSASHDWVPVLLKNNTFVVDLSGAYRLQNTTIFEKYYGFPHSHSETLKQAVYGLAEHYQEDIQQSDFIALPGCYPTASLTALKPLIDNELLDVSMPPIINAVSGVSGAGRKAALTNSFCEVSLQAYGIFNHRHSPEISQCLDTPVIFTPHLGNFKRGILATITAKLGASVDELSVHKAFSTAYENQPLVRLKKDCVKLDDVVMTPFCDISWTVDEKSNYIILSSALDNLLKGASSQAIQCINLRFNWPIACGLLP